MSSHARPSGSLTSPLDLRSADVSLRQQLQDVVRRIISEI
jgi:hypothetical protein